MIRKKRKEVCEQNLLSAMINNTGLCFYILLLNTAGKDGKAAEYIFLCFSQKYSVVIWKYRKNKNYDGRNKEKFMKWRMKNHFIGKNEG